jgi:hypothetical protein
MIQLPDNPIIIHTVNKLIIRWNKNPFNLTISVLWRGVYIPVKIKSFKIQYGETTTSTIIYKNKEYNHSMTKWKYMGGGHGEKFPKIETTTHKLHINVTLFALEIFDFSKGPENSHNQIENPFEVLYQS